MLNLMTIKTNGYWSLLLALNQTGQTASADILTHPSVLEKAQTDFLKRSIPWKNSEVPISVFIDDMPEKYKSNLSSLVASSFKTNFWFQPHEDARVYEEDTSYYKKRKLLQNRKISNKIFTDTSDDIYIFSGIQRHNLTNLLLPSSQTGDSKVFKDVVERIGQQYIILSCVHHKEHIRIYAKQTGINCHFIEYKESEFYWLHSYGSTESLRDKLIQNVQDEMCEDDLLKKFVDDDYTTCVCISDISGVGKTKLLKNLVTELQNKNKLAIVAEFADITQRLSATSIKNKEDLIELIRDKLKKQCKVTCPVRNKLICDRIDLGLDMIHVVIDGMDEVSVDLIEANVPFLKLFTSTDRIKLLTTTRSDSSLNIALKLGTLPYRLKPFSNEEQVQYLLEFWSHGSTNQVSDLAKKFAEKCIHDFHTTILDKYLEVAGIALLCNLMAEICKPQYDELCSNKGHTTDRNICVENVGSSIADVYETFMKQKSEVIIQELMYDLDADVSQDLMLIAVKELVPYESNILNDFVLSEAKIGCFQRIGLCKLGSHGVEFMHRSFAYYWFAKLMVYILQPIENLNEMRLNTAKLIKYIFSDIFATEVRSEPMISFPGQSERIKVCRFKNHMLMYFLNALLKTKGVLHRSRNPKVDTDRNTLWAIMNASVSHDLYYIFESFGIIRYLLTTMRDFRKDDLEAISNLIFASTKYLSEQHFHLAWKTIEDSLQITPINIYQPISGFLTSFKLRSSIIQIAVQEGKYGIVEKFFRGSEEAPWHEYYLLHICVRDTIQCKDTQILKDKVQLIRYLCRKCPKLLQVKFSKDDSTPILQPRVHLTILKLLLEITKDINEVTYNGDSLLHKPLCRSLNKKTMSLNDFTDLVRILLNRKCIFGNKSEFLNFSFPNCQKKTPLHLALESMDINDTLIRLFIDNGLNIVDVDNEGENLLFKAIRHQRSLSCIKLLLQYKGSLLEATNIRQETVLHVAAKNSPIYVFQHLLTEPYIRNTIINHLDENKNNALHIALQRQTSDAFDIQKLLIMEGVDLTARNSNGNCPLVHGFKVGTNLDTVNFMLDVMDESQRINPPTASQCIKALILNLGVVASSNHEDYLKILKRLMRYGGDFFLHMNSSPWKDEVLCGAFKQIFKDYTKVGSILLEYFPVDPETSLKRDVEYFLAKADKTNLSLTETCCHLLEKAFSHKPCLTGFCLVRQRLREVCLSRLTFRTPPPRVLPFVREIRQKNQHLIVEAPETGYYADRILETIGGSIKVCTGYEEASSNGMADIVILKIGDNQDLLRDTTDYHKIGRLVLSVTSLPTAIIKPHSNREILVDKLTWNDLTRKYQDSLIQKLDEYIKERHISILDKFVEKDLNSLVMKSNSTMTGPGSTLISTLSLPNVREILNEIICGFYRRRYEKAWHRLPGSLLVAMMSRTKFNNVVLRTLIDSTYEELLTHSPQSVYTTENFSILFGGPESQKILVEKLLETNEHPSLFTSKDELAFLVGREYSQTRHESDLHKRVLRKAFKLHERSFSILEYTDKSPYPTWRYITYFKFHYPIMLYALTTYSSEVDLPDRSERFKVLLACIADDFVDFIEKINIRSLLFEIDLMQTLMAVIMLGSIEMLQLINNQLAGGGIYGSDLEKQNYLPLVYTSLRRGNYRIVDYIFNHPMSLLKPLIDLGSNELKICVQNCVYDTTSAGPGELEARKQIMNFLKSKFSDKLADSVKSILIDVHKPHLDLIKHLVYIGANPHITDSLKNNIAHLAASYLSSPQYLELAQFLIFNSNGPLFKDRNHDVKSPVRCALENLPRFKTESDELPICSLLHLLSEKVEINYNLENERHLTIIQCAEEEVSKGQRHEIVLETIRKIAASQSKSS